MKSEALFIITVVAVSRSCSFHALDARAYLLAMYLRTRPPDVRCCAEITPLPDSIILPTDRRFVLLPTFIEGNANNMC